MCVCVWMQVCVCGGVQVCVCASCVCVCVCVCRREGHRQMYEEKKSKFHTNSAVHGAQEHVKLVIMNKDDNFKTRQPTHFKRIQP